jgi:WD40 repeat protein/serine/threonine protein kinase
MAHSDPSHDSIVHTDANAPSAERMEPSEIVARLSDRPRLGQRYEIKNEVGRGAMGAVLRVYDADLRRQLAVKVMLAFESANGSRTASQESSAARRYARFLEEAQITGQLDHPGIVPVHEIGLDGEGRLYFTMKLVRGRELREVYELVRKGEDGWNLTRALNVLLRVGEAMAFAHEKGVIHRDLKPDNVMVGRFGEVYVMDWGLAKVLGSTDTRDVRVRRADASHSLVRTERRDRAQEADSPLATMDGDIVGTPCYMPPEQARGRLEDIGPHSDVYSVGAMLYELLGGHMPYCGKGDRPTPQAVLGALIQGPPKSVRTLVKSLPDELVAICEKAMAREIPDRYPSMAGLTEDLRAYLEGRVVSAYETGALAEFKKWIARNVAFALTVGAALVLGFGGLYGMLALAQRKNAELSDQKGVLEQQKVELSKKNDELKEQTEAVESANTKLLAANELARRNEELAKTKEDFAKRMSYAASIGAADARLKIHDVAAARAQLLNKYNEDLRAWEWVHLLARCETSVRILSRFDEFVGEARMATHIASDAAGRVLAVCGQDSLSRQSATGVVRVLEVERRNELLEIPLTWGALEALAVSPDGQRIALVTADHVVRLFETSSAEPYAQWQGQKSASYRATLAFTPDGRELVVSLSERGLQFLASADAQPTREIRERLGVVTALTCSRDGERLAVGVDEGQLHLFSLADVQLERTIGERAASLRSLAFSPDGARILASTGLARGPDPRRGPWLFTVREWDVESGRLLSTWQDHQGSVNWCDYAAGGRLVVSLSDDRSLRVRDTLRGDAWSMLGHTGPVAAGAVTANGEMIASASLDGVVREWSPWLGEFATLAGHRRAIRALHFGDDSESLLSVAADGGVRLWDSRSALLVDVVQAGEPGADRQVVWEVAPKTAMGALAIGGGKLRLFDLERADSSQTLDTGESEALRTLAFSADGDRLAAASERGIAYVWTLGASGPPVTLRGARGEGAKLAWLAPNSLALGSLWQGRGAQQFSEINVFDVERRVSQRLLESLPGALFALQPSPDGAELLLGWRQDGERGVLRRVDAATLDARGGDLILDAEHATWFDEGRRIVAADRDAGVQLVDPGSGEVELTLHAPVELGAIAVSPDGQRIAAGYADGSIRVWSSDSPLARHTRRASAVRARAEALAKLEPLIRAEALEPQAALERALATVDIDDELRIALGQTTRLLRGERARLLADVREACRSPRREPLDYTLALMQATVVRRAGANSPEGAYGEGLALLRLGQLELAERALRDALGSSGSEKAPNETQALLALTLLRSKRRDEALAEYETYRKGRSVFEPVILDPTTRDLVMEIEAAFSALDRR